MKFFDILASASHNLWRNKSRTVLTIIAIFIGAFTISLTSAVNTGVNDYIDKQIGVFGTNKSILEVAAKQDSGMMSTSDEPAEFNPEKGDSSMGGMSRALTDGDLKNIKKVDGVEEVKGWKMTPISYIQGSNGKKYTLSARSTYEGMLLDTQAGKQIDASAKEYQINIPSSHVKSLGFSGSEDAVGKTVTVAVKNIATGEQKTVDAKVTGVLNKSLIQNSTGFYNDSLQDKLSDLAAEGMPSSMRDSYVTSLVKLKPGYDSDDKLQEVKTKLDKEGYAGQTIEDQIGQVRTIVNAVTGALIMFGAIALLAASFGIINTLYMSVQERTREIGLFKAMGLSSGKIFAMFSIEAILIGFWGSILGYGAAILAGGSLNGFASDSFLKGMDGFNLTMFTPESALTVCGIIMLIAFLSGTLPSRRAAKQDPIDALRYE